MNYKKFMTYNAIGALLWVGSLLPAGWYFGNFPIVKENFEFVIFGIIGISLLPMVIEVVRARFGRNRPAVVSTD